MTNTLNDALRVAHARFIAVVATCAVGVFVCFPRFSDAGQVHSLELADDVVSELDVPAIEKALLTQAQSSQAQSIANTIADALKPSVSQLATGPEAPALYRAVPLKLKTLGEVVEQARSGRQVALSGPHLENLAASLRWRFARIDAAEKPTLIALRIAGNANAAALSAEEAIEPARQTALAAQRTYDKAHARFAALTERIKAMAKAKAPGKEQWKVLEKRREAQAEMEAAQATLTNSQADFQKRAEAADAATFSAAEGEAGGSGMVVIAVVKHADAKQSEWKVPVRSVERAVVSAPVAIPASLDLLSRESPWPAIKDNTAQEAQAQLRESVSWHLWGGRLGPVHVGGLSVLHVFPLLLLLLSYWLSQQCGKAHRAYNPFEHPGSKLHKLGTNHAKLDMTLLIAPVVLVIVLDIWTLSRLDAEWWLALLFGAGAISYAVLVAQAFGDLQDLRTNIVRTSFPPPLTSER